jgi:hypothetical protein
MKTIKYFLLVGLVAGFVASANAQSIMSNLTGSYSTTGTNLGLGNDAADRTKGVGVTIGGSLDMIFQSMQAIISNPDGVQRLLSGGIYSDTGGNPGALLAAFNSVAIAPGTSAANVTLTTAAPFTLTLGATYWFILDGPDVANSLLWNGTSPNATPTASQGATFVGYRFSSNGGATWGNSTVFNAMQINAAPVPEPSTWLMVAAGACLLMGANRLRRRL